MDWIKEAEDALKKVPFFVRKKVRTRVEEQARAAGRKVVSLADVKTAQVRFLAKMSEEVKGYQIDTEKCMACGKCISACSTGTIAEKRKGYRIQLGGKLGRHPRLARELPGMYTEKEVLAIIEYCINFYKQNSIHGERFAETFKPSDFDALVGKIELE